MEMRTNHTLLKIVATTLILSLILVCIPTDIVSAKKYLPITVDVWTNRGGQGQNVPGGAYNIGEVVMIHYKVNHGCQTRLTVSGPSGTISNQQTGDYGITYNYPLGYMEEIDIGQWQVTLEAWDSLSSASDTTWFTVLPPPPPPPTLQSPPDTTSSPSGPEIDVWTNKGGQGQGVPGGQYNVGEQIIIYVMSAVTCETNWVLAAPSFTDSEQMILQGGGTYEWSPGVAQEMDVGQWQITFECVTPGLYASDSVLINVAGPSLSPPPTRYTSPAPSTPPVNDEQEPAGNVGVGNFTELDALAAIKMVEGSIPVDLSMDADGDGQVTIEDVRLIMQWAVKGKGIPLSQPPEGTGEMEEENIEPESESILGPLPEIGPSSTATDELLGKWKMTKISMQPIPDQVPNFVLNRLIPKKDTWEITSSNGELKIKYGGRDTWYKKTFLKGITEGPTTVHVSDDGLSCVFENPSTFSWDSLPLGLGLIFDVQQVNGSFISSVQISKSSGDNIEVTITVANVNGSYYENNNIQKPINYGNTTIIYRGVRK